MHLYHYNNTVIIFNPLAASAVWLKVWEAAGLCRLPPKPYLKK
ncbi:MAG: hypothetical protein V1925_04010 [Candidatus Omnitrophota bacterium]